MLENNENISLCGICKGGCCRRAPGVVFPEDIKEEITKESLKRYLDKGYAFDWWYDKLFDDQENTTNYYLRPQTITTKDKLFYPSWGGRCILHTDEGCSLNFEDRPTQCKALIPSKKDDQYNCKSLSEEKYGKKASALAWLKYNNIIKELHDEYKNEEA